MYNEDAAEAAFVAIRRLDSKLATNLQKKESRCRISQLIVIYRAIAMLSVDIAGYHYTVV